MRTDLEKTPANASELAQLGRRTRDEEQGGASLSGFERNHLFLSTGGVKFADISGISGLDDPADGRCFGILDYDHDGWQDIALVNANAPMLELYRNRIGGQPATLANPAGGRMVALRFVGGNHKALPSRTAVMLAPFPRCARIMRPFAAFAPATTSSSRIKKAQDNP